VAKRNAFDVGAKARFRCRHRHPGSAPMCLTRATLGRGELEREPRGDRHGQAVSGAPPKSMR
jgi:hypothetical protein